MSKTTTATNTRARAPRTRRWTCAECEVTVRYAAGSKATPAGPRDGPRRAASGSVCTASARRPSRRPPSARTVTVSRRQALLEFEPRRSPDVPDGVIAKRANCSTGHVRKVREEPVRGGKLPKAA